MCLRLPKDTEDKRGLTRLYESRGPDCDAIMKRAMALLQEMGLATEEDCALAVQQQETTRTPGG